MVFGGREGESCGGCNGEGLVLELEWDFDWWDIEDCVLGGCCELCCRGEDQSDGGERGKLPIQERHEEGLFLSGLSCLTDAFGCRFVSMTRVAVSWLVYRLTGSALLLRVGGLCGADSCAGVLVERAIRPVYVEMEVPGGVEEGIGGFCENSIL